MGIFKTSGIPYEVVKDTSEIKFECPKCKEDGLKYQDKKLSFNTKKNLGHCFRCEWVGGGKKFLKLIGIGSTTQAPAPSLKELKNAVIEGRKREPSEIADESILPRQIKPAGISKRARYYLRKRGFSRRSIERYGILYCFGGYFKNRIIIPIFDERGRYRTFVARYIGKSKSDTIKKYLYPKGCRTSRLLYGLHTNKKNKRRRFAILVEGFFDAVHCSPFGVGCFGTNVSDHQIELLREAGVRKVVFCFDNDKKKRARENVNNSIKRARKKMQKYFEIKVIKLPRRPSDPTDYKPKQIFKWARKALEL